MATGNSNRRIVDSLVNIVRNAVQLNSVDGDDSADFASVLKATRASLRACGDVVTVRQVGILQLVVHLTQCCFFLKSVTFVVKH